MINDLVDIIKNGDCADCWMTAPERAAAALDEYFSANRKAALIKDGGEGAVLLHMWALGKKCDIRVFEASAADDRLENYRNIRDKAGREGYKLVIDGETADEADVSVLVQSGVRAPLFLSNIKSEDIPLLKHMLGTRFAIAADHVE